MKCERTNVRLDRTVRQSIGQWENVLMVVPEHWFYNRATRRANLVRAVVRYRMRPRRVQYSRVPIGRQEKQIGKRVTMKPHTPTHTHSQAYSSRKSLPGTREGKHRGRKNVENQE